MRFRAIATRQNNAKNKFENILVNIYTESIAMDQIVNFASKFYIIFSKNLDVYFNGEISREGVIGASLFRMGCLITGVRYLVSAAIGGESATRIMSDANHLVTNQRLFSMIISLSAFVILFIALLLRINEMHYKLTLLDFMFNWKSRRVLPLEAPRSCR